MEDISKEKELEQMARMTRTMSRDSRLTTHASLDANTDSRDSQRDSQRDSNRDGQRERQRDRNERGRSASWDRSQRPRSDLSLSEAKEEWRKNSGSNESEVTMGQRLRDLGTKVRKLVKETDTTQIEEGIRRLSIDSDKSVKRKHSNDDDEDFDENLGAAAPRMSRDHTSPKRLITPDREVEDSLPILPRVSEGVYEDEGSDIDEDVDRYHDDANVNDDDALLRQIRGIQGKQVEYLKAQIEEKNNQIIGLRRTLERNNRDHEQLMAEQEEALLARDEEIRQLTETAMALNRSLATMSRDCESMRETCSALEDKLSKEEEERAEEDKSNKLKIRRLEKDVREAQQARDYAEAELDRKSKESMLDSNKLKMTITKLKDECMKAAESTEELESQLKTKLDEVKERLARKIQENEGLQDECRNMKTRLNRFKKGSVAGVVDMKRSASQLSLNTGPDIMVLSDDNDDEVEVERPPKLTTKESLQLLSQVKWPRPEIFCQTDAYIRAIEEHIEMTRERGLKDKDIANHLHNDLIASSLASNYSSHCRQVNKATTKGILTALKACNRIDSLRDNSAKFGSLDQGKREDRPAYVVRLDNAYRDYNLGDKSDPVMYEKQKNRAVREQFFKGAKIPEKIRNMLATCLDLDEIVLCVEAEMKKLHDEQQQQRPAFNRQPRQAPRTIPQERAYSPNAQVQQPYRNSGQSNLHQRGSDVQQKRSYNNSGSWQQQPRGPYRPVAQYQRQQQPTQQQRLSPQTTQRRSPPRQQPMQRSAQQHNSAFQQRQPLLATPPQATGIDHGQVNALMDAVRDNVQRHVGQANRTPRNDQARRRYSGNDDERRRYSGNVDGNRQTEI